MEKALLLSLLALLIGAPFGASADSYSDVHPCDEYAAHPEDPNRWAAGLPDAEIIPGPAVKFCRDAVTAYPETARFHFQLGRALWAANQHEEGLAVFLELEKNDQYAPAYAYVGDAYMYGLGGVEVDQELAISLYQMAESGGFAPAGDVLAVISGEHQSEATADGAPTQLPPLEPEQKAVSTPTVPPFNARDYSQPSVLEALNAGNLEGLDSSNLGRFSLMGVSHSKLDVYLGNFNSQFSGTYNFKDPNCIKIYSPRVEKSLVIEAMTENFGGSPEEMIRRSLEGVLELRGQLEQGSGAMDMVKEGYNLETLKEEAAQDAAKLILSYGCESEIVQRIYANVKAYVIGTPPILTEDEQIRQKEMRKRETEKAEREMRAANQRAEEQKQASLRMSAKSSCVKKYERETFCDCLIGLADDAGISDSEWKDLSRKFETFVELGRKNGMLGDGLRSCRKKN